MTSKPSRPASSSIQVVIQRQTLVVVRVYGDFGYERWGREQLHFDPGLGHEVVGGGEAGAQQRDQSG
jgi:hypothetical protein